MDTSPIMVRTVTGPTGKVTSFWLHLWAVPPTIWGVEASDNKGSTGPTGKVAVLRLYPCYTTITNKK